MDITLNGRPAAAPDGATVADLVHERVASPRSVAVAVNGQVVTADAWAQTGVTAGDVVDIVTARQGG